MTASYWRSGPRGLSPVRRSTLLGIVALLHAVLVTVASLFSSKVTSTTSEVLVRSLRCGVPVFSPLNALTLNQEDVPAENALYVTSQWTMERSLAYSNACYRGVSSSAYACNEFVRRNLESKVNTTEECPFPGEICVTPALSVDTGYVDSDFHLGINAPASNRISFRKKLTCAPVNADDYTPGWTTEGLPPIFPWDPDLISGAAYKFYNFGEQVSFGLTRNWSFSEANYTGSSEKAYNVMSIASFVGGDAFASFNPIPEFNRTDADVSLWFLRNRAYYTGEVQDPFFKATTPNLIGTLQLYKPDSTVNALACTEQYSFCNNTTCTTLDALIPITRDLVTELLGYNTAQLATFDLVWRWVWAMRVYFLVFILQDQILLASSQNFGTYRVSVELPTNQWQLEVGNLFNVSLAMLQLIGLEYVSPPEVQVTPNTTYDMYITTPNTTEGKNLCNSQKILSNGQYSFNFFGLMFILVGGSLVIVLSNAGPPLLARWQAKSSDERVQYRRREWTANDVLHLQSVAFDGRGIGPWTMDADVPVLMKGAIRFKLPWLLEDAESVCQTHNRDTSRVELLPLNDR